MKKATKVMISTVSSVLLLTFCSGELVAGDNLLNGGDGEDEGLLKKWTGAPSQRNSTEKKSGDASIQLWDINWLFSPDLIPVDTSKTYELKAQIKTAKDKKPTQGLLGVRYYNADKMELSALSVCPVKGAITTLAAAAKKGDKSVIIPGDAAWTVGSLFGVAFNAADDLSDLPNLSAVRMVDMKKKDGTLEVILKSPLEKDYPAGTKVRQQRYIDFTGMEFTTTDDWKELTLKLSGQNEPGSAPVKNQMWLGTKYIRIAIFSNMSGKADNSVAVLFDDISFSEVSGVPEVKP